MMLCLFSQVRSVYCVGIAIITVTGVGTRCVLITTHQSEAIPGEVKASRLMLLQERRACQQGPI